MTSPVERLVEYLHGGGVVMAPLMLGAVVLWYGLGYRLLALRRGSRASLAELLVRARTGQLRSCRGIVAQAAQRAGALGGRAGQPLRAALDVQLFSLEQELGRFSVIVQAIVIAAPLAGLLGTVAGMIETFEALGDMSLFSQSGGIAGGISQALITTQMGLMVAIPGLVVGRMLTRRERRLAAELAQLKQLVCATAPARSTDGRTEGSR